MDDLAKISMGPPADQDGVALRAWPPDAAQLAQVAPGWRPVLDGFLASDPGAALARQLQAALVQGATVYPPQPLRALSLTAPEDVRVLILGQDPYHGPRQANGLAFAVAPGVRTPPSLRNIYKELARDFGRAPRLADGGAGPVLLEHWARQGVLLLNTSLTVAAGEAGSHARWGWAALTDALIAHVARQPRPVAFLMWGAHAQAKAAIVTDVAGDQRHGVLRANHPSPLSALRPPVPFLGCGHFSAANAFLAARGLPAIDWLADSAQADLGVLAVARQTVA